MKLTPICAALFAAGALAAASAMAADRLSKDAYASEKDRIAAAYKVDIERCSSLSGNAKDICKAEVRGKQKSAKADAYAAYKGTDKAATAALIARADAAQDKRDASYEVARERCDALAGDAKTQCINEAKARFGKS